MAANPSYMSPQQMRDYLNDLRSQPLQRPTGSRPYPGSSSLRRSLHGSVSQDLLSNRHSLAVVDAGTSQPPPRAASALSKRQSLDPTPSPRAGVLPRSYAGSPTPLSYIDSDERQKERLEAHIVRLALEGMDLKEEEKIHAAAHKEAEKLIWKHKHPDAAYRLDGSIERAEAPLDLSLNDPTQPNVQPASDDLHVVKRRSSLSKLSSLWHPSSLSQRRRSSGQKRSMSGKHKGLFDNPKDKIYEDPSEKESTQSASFEPKDRPQAKIPAPLPIPSHVRKNPFARAHTRRSTPAVETPIRLEPNPLPASSTSSVPHENVLARELPRGSSHKDDNVEIGEMGQGIRYRNGIEVRSDDLRAATNFSLKNRSPRLPSPSAVSDSSRRPIVSFKPDWSPPKVQEAEIPPEVSVSQRPAPMPRRLNSDLVSEPVKSASAPTVPTIGHPGPSIQYNNGRLVTTSSPQHHYENSRSQQHQYDHDVLSINVSKVPSISISEVPVINISGPPSISISEAPPVSVSHIPAIAIISAEDPPATQSPISWPSNSKSLPHPSINDTSSHSHHGHRPQPHHSSTAPSRPWNSIATRRPTALCAQCALPISGKIVTAASTRFHPACFACYTCATPLECVAFYPEPNEKRSARLSRIERRAAGESLPYLNAHGEHMFDEAGQEVSEDVTAAEEDGDDGLRFYCHLDFHELFSPRCKSCKTPIEGEVIVACGAEWHVGHFFCAECGDPFNASTPYIQRDDYAWCLPCHTRRYSPKCRRCRKPVTETGVKAEGFEWHEACFVCLECKTPFDDGAYFMREDEVGGFNSGPVCVTCEERRLKA